MKLSFILLSSFFIFSFGKQYFQKDICGTYTLIYKTTTQSKSKNADCWLGFDSILQDSRCPKGVNCMWAGNVSIQFTFCNKNIIHTIQLTVPNLPNQPNKNDTTIDGYHFILKDVLPYPQNNVTIPIDKTQAIIKVEKAK